MLGVGWVCLLGKPRLLSCGLHSEGGAGHTAREVGR